MPAIITGLEKQLAEIALRHLPLTIILIAAVIVLAVIVAIRYNKKISQAQTDKEQAAIVQKQQCKIIRLLGDLPCVSKRNATRLADPKQDGNFPDRAECNYANAIEKGDI